MVMHPRKRSCFAFVHPPTMLAHSSAVSIEPRQLQQLTGQWHHHRQPSPVAQGRKASIQEQILGQGTLMSSPSPVCLDLVGLLVPSVPVATNQFQRHHKGMNNFMRFTRMLLNDQFYLVLYQYPQANHTRNFCFLKLCVC